MERQFSQVEDAVAAASKRQSQLKAVEQKQQTLDNLVESLRKRDEDYRAIF